MLCERWGMPTYLWRRTQRKSRGRAQKKRGQAGLEKKKVLGRKGKWLENDMKNRDHVTGWGRDGKTRQPLRRLMKCVKCGLMVLWRQGPFPAEITKTGMSPDWDIIKLHCPPGLFRSRFNVCGPTKPPSEKDIPLFHFGSYQIHFFSSSVSTSEDDL